MSTIAIRTTPRGVVFVGEPVKAERLTMTEHFPETDEDVKQVIRGLDHYYWETHKVTGRYTPNPYSLTATIAGVQHTIYIKRRFGTALSWLGQQVERIEKAAAKELA